LLSDPFCLREGAGGWVKKDKENYFMIRPGVLNKEKALHPPFILLVISNHMIRNQLNPSPPGEGFRVRPNKSRARALSAIANGEGWVSS
jgi:hypothetical protein